MGYNQNHVALLLGLKNTNRVSRWEKGVSLPNTVNLIKLSIIYRTFPNELYFDLMLKLRHDLLHREKMFLHKRE
jgi:transcriptional regulator with XRE-family HTH domain